MSQLLIHLWKVKGTNVFQSFLAVRIIFRWILCLEISFRCNGQQCLPQGCRGAIQQKILLSIFNSIVNNSISLFERYLHVASLYSFTTVYFPFNSLGEGPISEFWGVSCEMESEWLQTGLLCGYCWCDRNRMCLYGRYGNCNSTYEYFQGNRYDRFESKCLLVDYLRSMNIENNKGSATERALINIC